MRAGRWQIPVRCQCQEAAPARQIAFRIARRQNFPSRDEPNTSPVVAVGDAVSIPFWEANCPFDFAQGKTLPYRIFLPALIRSVVGQAFPLAVPWPGRQKCLPYTPYAIERFALQISIQSTSRSDIDLILMAN